METVGILVFKHPIVDHREIDANLRSYTIPLFKSAIWFLPLTLAPSETLGASVP